MKLLQQLVEAKYSGDQPKSLQQAIRILLVRHGGEWRPGWSRAYKDLSPNGKMRVKFDGIRNPDNPEELKAAIHKLPKVSGVQSFKGDSDLLVWFDADPGIGKKITEKAYKQRLSTVILNLRSLRTASGKTNRQIISDLHDKL